MHTHALFFSIKRWLGSDLQGIATVTAPEASQPARHGPTQPPSQQKLPDPTVYEDMVYEEARVSGTLEVGPPVKVGKQMSGPGNEGEGHWGVQQSFWSQSKHQRQMLGACHIPGSHLSWQRPMFKFRAQRLIIMLHHFELKFPYL